MSSMPPAGPQPPRDCGLCPRLAAFRAEARAKFPDWFNAPVPDWGDPTARLVIVGLAPGLKGANRTGRPFTGDYAGDLLYATLGKAGLSAGQFEARPDDGLVLNGVMIANAVKCVPPENKPVGAEIAACRPFLAQRLLIETPAPVLLALGRITHQSAIATLGLRQADFAFAHGARHELGRGRVLYDSFHCSRYNTNTGRLTETMFEQVVFAAAREAFPDRVAAS